MLLSIGIWFFYVQQKSFSPSFVSIENQYINEDVLLQLRYLKIKLHEQNGAIEQQRLYPEGFVFANVLYGLAWIDFASHLDKNTSLFQEATTESLWAWQQLQTEDGIKGFSTNLLLPRGAFYTGWTNYLLGKHLLLNREKQDTILQSIFTNNCKSIAYALQKNNATFLESYDYQIWQADNLLCLATLKLYQKLTQRSDFEEIANRFLIHFKANLNPDYQLVPHNYSEKKEKFSLPRGSSQSLMNCFWQEVDSAFAKQQFAAYRNAFLAERLKFKGVREFPQGIESKGDVDSGPVIWGIGAAASVVAPRAFYTNGDTTNAALLNQSIETFGFPKKDHNTKQYLWGEVLMLDLFRAWTLAVNNCY